MGDASRGYTFGRAARWCTLALFAFSVGCGDSKPEFSAAGWRNASGDGRRVRVPMAQALIDEGRIHAGMRVDEVVSLLGDEGRVETASGARAYGYCLGPALEGEGYEFLFVYFDDERTVTTLHRTRF